jgi:hypothetical protein
MEDFVFCLNLIPIFIASYKLLLCFSFILFIWF